MNDDDDDDVITRYKQGFRDVSAPAKLVSLHKRNALLKLLSSTLSMRYCCNELKISICTVRNMMKKDDDFRSQVDEAISAGVDALEDEAVRRATGYIHPLNHQGKHTGDTETRYSDNLLMFRLKGERPDKYKDNANINIHNTKAILINKYDGMSDDEIRESLREKEIKILKSSSIDSGK